MPKTYRVNVLAIDRHEYFVEADSVEEAEHIVKNKAAPVAVSCKNFIVTNVEELDGQE